MAAIITIIWIVVVVALLRLVVGCRAVVTVIWVIVIVQAVASINIGVIALLTPVVVVVVLNAGGLLLLLSPRW